MLLLECLVEFLTTDEPSWPFLLLFRLQFIFGFCSLGINFVLTLYAFGAGDCYNPHTSMWRSMLIVDMMATVGSILDASSALKFQGTQLSSNSFGTIPSYAFPSAVDYSPSPILSASISSSTSSGSPSLSVPPQQSSSNGDVKNGPPSSVNSTDSLSNFTVIDCTVQRPYLFLTLIARQWAALLVLFMGMERLMFLLYPLWLRSIRMNMGPTNVFAVFFALFSTGIAYTNATYVAAYEQTHFSCEASWAFGEDFGWLFYGIVISPQYFGCLFCIIAYFMVHHEHALRKFGGNRLKIVSEKRKLRKIKWLLITCFAFIAVPQSLLFLLQLVAPQRLFLLKVLISQLFLAKCFGNILMYNRAIASTRFGFSEMLKQWWEKRRKVRVKPSEAVNSVSFMVAQPQQHQQQRTTTNA